MNEDDADIEVINCSPTFDNELNFSNHCVNKINNMLSNNLLEGNKNHDDEEFIAVGKGLDNGIVKQLTKQKCFALNYQLWIFELYCKPIDDEQVRSLINELAELIPETNYYHSLLTRKKAMSDSYASTNLNRHELSLRAIVPSGKCNFLNIEIVDKLSTSIPTF
ncbi:15406_t:CDS:2 [Entrophospora sp. SA101]|nr:15406_t:CDS:2 [Entrophospora sp. SA101]